MIIKDILTPGVKAGGRKINNVSEIHAMLIYHDQPHKGVATTFRINEKVHDLLVDEIARYYLTKMKRMPDDIHIAFLDSLTRRGM